MSYLLFTFSLFFDFFEKRPHVCFVEAQLSLCTEVDSQCSTSTDPDLSCLVVTAPLSQDKKQIPYAPSHSVV